MDSQAGGRPDAPCLLPLIAKAVKLSQELPTVNTPAFVYYNDFPHYKAVAAGQSRRILSVIQKMLDILDAKSNVLDITNTNSREKFSSIVDANDRLLERLSMAMDFEEDPSRKSSRLTAPESLVVAVEKRQHTSLEWLKNKSEAQDSDGLLRLLSSTHVRRPQSLFSTPPDNSASPFRPRLAYKPNAIRSLSLSLPDQLPDDEEAPHPYEAELAFFATALANWEPLQVTSLPAPLDTNYQFIDQPDALDMAIKELSTHLEVAVDLEHHNYRTYFGITCLIQLSTISMDYVLDALTLRDHLYKLNEIFTNPKIIKVFHGSELDLMWLQRDFSVYVVNLFDTGLAARALQLGHYSLSYLLQRYANVRTCKKYQLADWRIRPLPAELIEYARTDTHYLLYIGSLLCQELQDRGLLHVVLEGGRQMCLKCYTKPPFDPLGYMNLYKHAAGTNFNHRQLYALEQLYALRDSIARREDESVHYVLPNHMLKVISEVLPRESSGLFACCNPIPPLVRKYVHDLHKIVLDARDRLLSELPLTADSGVTDVAKPESEDSVVLDTSAYADLQRSQPALPHDQSGGHDTIGVQRITGAADLKRNPSILGRHFSSPLLPTAKKPGDEIKNDFIDPNRMLLKKLIIMLSADFADVAQMTSPDSCQATSTPVNQSQPSGQGPVATPTFNLPTKITPHPSWERSSPSNALASDADKSDIKAASIEDDSDDVVILREEMPSRSSHKKRRKLARQKRKELSSSANPMQMDVIDLTKDFDKNDTSLQDQHMSSSTPKFPRLLGPPSNHLSHKPLRKAPKM